MRRRRRRPGRGGVRRPRRSCRRCGPTPPVRRRHRRCLRPYRDRCRRCRPSPRRPCRRVAPWSPSLTGVDLPEPRSNSGPGLRALAAVTAARVRAILAPPAAGALLALSMPPWGWWPLAFVAFALLDRLVAGRPARSRAAVGCGFGAGWLFPATFWMIDLTLPGYFAQGFIFTAFFGLAT